MNGETIAALTSPGGPSHAYLQGQMHASQGPLLEAYDRESAASVAAFQPALDIAYGAHEREVFDFYRSSQPWRGTLAYFHAGYWQSRDKAQFRFLAPAFLDRGIDLALVNYPLCPDVSLRRLVASAKAAVFATLDHARAMGRGGERLVASGHSAGGHLSVELAMTDWAEVAWESKKSAAGGPIKAILALSGVYELEPLLATKLNDKLALDLAEAHALSPLRRSGTPDMARASAVPALFAVGGVETPAFQAQSQAMHEVWIGSGGSSSFVTVDGADHFSILRALGADGRLFEPTLALFD